MNRRLAFPLFILVLILGILACSSGGPPAADEAVPSGDPPFPTFTGSWVIDSTGTVPQGTITQTNAVLQKLRDDGIAEVVIFVVNGVKNEPELYATRLGRHLKLGSTETDNGMVYLVRPDAPSDEHLIYSAGRGLTAFTSGRVTEALQNATVLANTGDYSAALLATAQGTDGVLRQLYKPRPETVTNNGEPTETKYTPEQQRAILITILVIAVVWILIGVFLGVFVDPEAGLQWILLGLRILLLIATMGKVNVGTGGSSKFGGRSGSR